VSTIVAPISSIVYVSYPQELGGSIFFRSRTRQLIAEKHTLRPKKSFERLSTGVTVVNNKVVKVLVVAAAPGTG
jgi:hypothetical protein